jgi:hypothetical protein
MVFDMQALLKIENKIDRLLQSQEAPVKSEDECVKDRFKEICTALNDMTEDYENWWWGSQNKGSICLWRHAYTQEGETDKLISLTNALQYQISVNGRITKEGKIPMTKNHPKEKEFFAAVQNVINS